MGARIPIGGPYLPMTEDLANDAGGCPRADPEARVAGERGERARAPFEGLDQPHERLLRVPCPTRSRGDVRTSPSDATVRAPRAGAPTAAWGIAREPSADLGDEG